MSDDTIVKFERRKINEWPRRVYLADMGDGDGCRPYASIQHPDDTTPHYVRGDLYDALLAERDALRAELSSGSFYKESDIDALEAERDELRRRVEAEAEMSSFFHTEQRLLWILAGKGVRGMSDAPEEIKVRWGKAANDIRVDCISPCYAVRDRTGVYIREDHALAMVAAECEGLVNEAAGMADGPDEAAFIEKRMRGCIPDDAKVALDALLKAERVKALREAADCIGHITRAEDKDAILALIEKETGHE